MPPLLRRELHLVLPPARDLLALAGLGAFVLLLFPRVVFAGQAFFNRDVHLVWYPVLAAFVANVAEGAWPLWDPYRGFGQPLLADPSAQLAYPPTWLNLLLLPHVYYRAFALGHLVLAAWGVYALARSWRVSRLGAFVAGAAYAGTGPLLSLVDLYHHLAGAAWAPWVVLAADRLLEAPRLRRGLAFAAALAAQVLAGSGDMLALTVAAVALAVALRHLDWSRPLGSANRRRLVALALGATLAAGLSAVQWLPTLEVAERAARHALFTERDRDAWSLHPLGLLEIVMPFRWSQLPQLTPDVRDTFDLQAPLLRSLHLGLPVLVLALAALGGRHRRTTAWLAVVGLGALAVALGRHAPAYGLVTGLAPPLASLRYPVKATLLVSFAAALLAGLGVDAWREALGRPRGAWQRIVAAAALSLTIACVLAAAAVWLAPERLGVWLFPRWQGPPFFREIFRPVGWRLAAGAACGFGVAACARLAASRVAVAWVAAALTLASLAVAHVSLHPTVDPAFFTLRPPPLDVLLREERHPRIYVYDYSDEARKRSEGLAARAFGYRLAFLPAGLTREQALAAAYQMYVHSPLAGRWGLRGSYDLDGLGLYPLYLANLTEYLRSVEPTPAHLRLLQAGGVQYVLALLPEPWWRALERLAELPGLFTEPIRVMKVPDPVPRVSIVGTARRLDGEAALAALGGPDFDPRREVLLASGPVLEPDRSWSGSSRILEERPDRLRVAVSGSGPGYLVVLDAYDPGWQARVDGRPALVHRANVAFRAVPVPAGEHEVELVYRPWAVAVGVGLTLAALLLGLGLALRVLATRPEPAP